ncbi:MAG TPA: SCO family protein [Vicinamibacterales bacterium]|nr:SCO family protein [Vicinamibacterales bacterium]
MDVRTWRTAVLAGAMVIAAAPVSAQSGAQGLNPQPGIPSSQMPGVLGKVAFEQRLNEPLPLDLTFTDEDGRRVKLGDYFGKRPVVLAFVYYECPMLCTLVLNGLTGVLSLIDETAGKEFDVVAVSFDPRETPVLAAAKKKTYLDTYKRPQAANGWHFLTGAESSIAALTQAAGFSYAWDEATQQFAHASGIVVATPDGRLSRYFFGVDYAARDVQFALIESSAGKVGSLADKLMLYCYHYDPVTGQYGFVAMRAVRIGGVVTLVALAGFMFVSIRRENRASGH